jgi:AcrR family transcriptional regulator
VLTAAGHLLRQKPYYEITMKEIASLAEFSVGYLYKLFPNKEELFTSLIQQKLEERESITKRFTSSSGPAGERLERLVQELCAWREENTAFSPGVIGAFLALVEGNPSIRRILAEHDSRERLSLGNMFEEGMRDGSIRPGDPQLLASAFKALMAGSLLSELLRDTPGEQPHTMPELQSVVLQTIRQAFVISQPTSEGVTDGP